MDNTKQSAEVITLRRAADFGSKLAIDLAEKLQKEKVEAFKWPEHFPITIKQIIQLPELDKNTKVAKRVSDAAKAIWKEIHREAITVEAIMLANPEHYENPHEKQEWTWRELFMEIEQAAGSIFLTDHANEDVAKKRVYDLLHPIQLKSYIIEFEQDYKNFINEIREKIRAKKVIAASTRLELICMLNTNTQIAKKIKVPMKTLKRLPKQAKRK
jgi:hypothetical protein